MVEQAGLADIRLADEDDVQTAVQQPALLRSLEHLLQALLQAVEATPGIGGFDKFTSSSGKSSAASTSARSSTSCASRALISRENSPCSERTALRAAAVVAASIRSISCLGLRQIEVHR